MVVDGAVMVPNLGFFYWNQQPKAEGEEVFLFPFPFPTTIVIVSSLRNHKTKIKIKIEIERKGMGSDKSIFVPYFQSWICLPYYA